jgi:hypothetical protein
MTHPSEEVIRRLADITIYGSIDQLIAQIEDGSAARGWERLCAEAFERDTRSLAARTREHAHIIITREEAA